MSYSVDLLERTLGHLWKGEGGSRLAEGEVGWDVGPPAMAHAMGIKDDPSELSYIVLHWAEVAGPTSFSYWIPSTLRAAEPWVRWLRR